MDLTKETTRVITILAVIMLIQLLCLSGSEVEAYTKYVNVQCNKCGYKMRVKQDLTKVKCRKCKNIIQTIEEDEEDFDNEVDDAVGDEKVSSNKKIKQNLKNSRERIVESLISSIETAITNSIDNIINNDNEKKSSEDQ